MKNIVLLILICFICASCNQTEQNFLEGKDAYFGLTPPGLSPEVFAPGIVSDSTWAEHCQVAVSPDGKEIYWSAWSSKYPPADTSMKNSEQIYFSEFKDGDWTPSFTKDGNAYHMGNYAYNRNEKPLKFKYSNGKFSKPDTVIIHPDFKPYYAIYVSSDESYLLFSARHKDGFGSLDLYICFRTTDNKWGTPINMGEKINTEKIERFPTVSPDGKYLFFMRHTPGQDFFWVSTEIFKELKKQSKYE